MIKNIIFDLGNVLLDQKNITADVYFASVFHIPQSDSELFYAPYKRGAVRGTIPFIELVKLYKDKFGSSFTEEEIVEQYKQLYINDIYSISTDLLQLIKELKEKYHIYMMTNTLEPHFEHWKTLGFNSHFDRIFRSDTDHFAKPEKEAYEYVVKEIGSMPDECIFIDDLLVNVQGAIQIGIKGLVFTNSTTLKDDLMRLGVI